MVNNSMINTSVSNCCPTTWRSDGVDWDIVYDDRGHFTEPHTEKSIGLGTIAVRNYLAGW